MQLLFYFGLFVECFCLLIALLIIAVSILTYRKSPKPNRRALTGCILMILLVVGYILSIIVVPLHGLVNYLSSSFIMLTVMGINNITIVVPSYKEKKPGLALFTTIVSVIIILFCLPICIFTLYFSA
jgi:hypothetical protein